MKKQVQKKQKQNSRTFEKQNLMAAIVLMVILFIATPANADTIFVDINNTSVEDGTIDHPFNTIQEGINAAIPEDTVKVAPGIYSGNITISGENISLIGENPKTTIISGTSNVITINGTFNSGYELVEIAGFTIKSGVTNGIYFNSSSVIGKIHNNIIFGNGNGIFDNYSCKASIYNNLISKNTGAGITNNSGYHPNFTISNNIIIQNGTYGINRTNGTYLASFNNVWHNGTADFNGTISQTLPLISENPSFVSEETGDYSLSAGSPSIDKGQPIASDNDPDGTTNDQGVYGGPGAANFWPYTAGGPIVTNLSVTPTSIPVGGSLTLQATGKIQ